MGKIRYNESVSKKSFVTCVGDLLESYVENQNPKFKF